VKLQEDRAEEPQPRDADDRVEHRGVAVRDLQVGPGLGERVPVDRQPGVGSRRTRHQLRRDPAEQGDGQHDRRHGQRAVLAEPADQQPGADGAEQDRDEGAHLHQAVAAGQLVRVEVLRQVGELDRAEHGRLQPEQEDGQVDERRRLQRQAGAADQRHRDLGVLDAADEP